MIGFDSLLKKDYMEVPLLPEKYLESYDIKVSRNNIQEKIDKFISLQVEYSHITPPQITRNYEVIYNDSSKTVKDNVGDYVIKKITTKEDVKEYYNDIYNALSQLNRQEVMYFIDSLYNRHTNTYISENRDISIYNLKKIQDSCIIKLCQYFNLAEKKKSSKKRYIVSGGDKVEAAAIA